MTTAPVAETATERTVALRISEYRAAKVTTISGLLSASPIPQLSDVVVSLPNPMNWALSNHLFRVTLATAGGHCIDHLTDWLADPAVWLGPHLLDRYLVAPIELCDSIPFGGEMPLSAVSPRQLASAEPAGAARTTIAEALESLSQTGYGHFLGDNLAVIVPLKHRRVDDAMSSWSSTVLRGTIYTDFNDVGAVFGNELLHEATHCWLNDALDAYALDLVGDEIYYSPWKRSKRTAYGLLHSVMAFSRVCNYLEKIAATTGNTVIRTYAEVRTAAERSRLNAVHDQFFAVLDTIGGHPITDLVAAEYRTAITVPHKPAR